MFAVKKTDGTRNGAPHKTSSESNSKSNEATNNKKSILKGRPSITPPTSLFLNGVQVHFPFKPYDVQEKYMTSVLRALQNSEHALLESPTGTGKTLCLLCSALAWQQAERAKYGSAGVTQQPSVAAAASDGLTGKSQTNSSKPSHHRPPIIIYASRTHSQLSQVVRELRNTRYRPRHAVLGSREHMCVHPKVNPLAAKSKSNPNVESVSSSEVNHGCNKLNKERKCIYRNNLDDAAGHGGTWAPPDPEGAPAGRIYEQPVLDMEDLVTMGKQQRICPFYHTRSLLKDAELIFVPYNYLFDRDARETTLAEVDFANAVLIFDEAHNLEEFASESSSFDLSSSNIAGCIGEVQRAIQYMELNPDANHEKMKDNMLKLKAVFLRFEQYLLNGNTQGTTATREGETSHSGEFIFHLFKEAAGITYTNKDIFLKFVREVGDRIMEFKGNTSSSGTPNLDHFVNCVKKAYGTGTELLALARAKSYRVHMTKVVGSGNGGGYSGGRTISYWCFAPALAMRELSFLKVRSILITSGTLSPLPSFSLELGLHFPVQLENNHVIQPDQIYVRVLGKGVSGKELSSKFGRRDNPEYILELGNTLASLCRVIPGGVLVFFPSYSSMDNCVQSWGGPSARNSGNGGAPSKFFAARKQKSTPKYSFPQVPTHFMTEGASTPWTRLLAKKPIVLEPRSTNDLTDAIAEFKKFISMPKSAGCILMGVCRGKISEGIDFSDDMCRAVIVTGLPFAPYLDPKVKLKREFLDAARATERVRPSDNGGFGEKATLGTESSTLSGAEWYNQQAHRAVNQAIGRVIRHRHDYGAILLLDHRFAEIRNKEGLSKWLRPHLKEEAIGLATRGLVKFYKESKTKADNSSAQNTGIHISVAARPHLAYEEDDNAEVHKIAVIQPAQSKPTDPEGNDDNGYIKPDRIIRRFDLKDDTSSSITAKSKVPETDEEHTPSEADGLAAFYSNENAARQYPSKKIFSTKSPSRTAWSELATARGPSRTIRREKTKRQSLQRGKVADNSKMQAKRFFEKAKSSLAKEDLKKVQILLVEMKKHGDEKNSEQYLKSLKALLAILLNCANAGCQPLELVQSLFPLLPVKYRPICVSAGKVSFERGSFCSKCRDILPEEDFLIVKKIASTLLFPSSYTEAATRALLEDSQKVIAILMNNDEHLLPLLYTHTNEHLRTKLEGLAREMKKQQRALKAKELLHHYKGEKCINDTLFRPTQLKLSIEGISSQDKLDDGKDMKEALLQANSFNQRKKDRIDHFQRNLNVELEKVGRESHLPRYCKGAKRLCTQTSAPIKQEAVLEGDLVDQCLHSVNSKAFIDANTRLARICGKVKARIPLGFSCSICANKKPNEPLMADCGHTACTDCWKVWLKRSRTCPTCRKQTTMDSLATMVFEKVGVDPSSLTQLCKSDSDDDLEITVST